jgi:ATP-binding cassette subfamily B (MDR/TAP) protein 1
VLSHTIFSQIEPKDFVYVLTDGMVVEQGFWYDLEAEPEYGHEGEEMMEAQCRMGGFLLGKSPGSRSHPRELLDADANDEQEPMFNLTVNVKHQSLARPALQCLRALLALQAVLVASTPLFTVSIALQLMAFSEFSFTVPSRFRLLTESPF